MIAFIQQLLFVQPTVNNTCQETKIMQGFK